MSIENIFSRSSVRLQYIFSNTNTIYSNDIIVFLQGPPEKPTILNSTYNLYTNIITIDFNIRDSFDNGILVDRIEYSLDNVDFISPTETLLYNRNTQRINVQLSSAISPGQFIYLRAVNEIEPSTPPNNSIEIKFPPDIPTQFSFIAQNKSALLRINSEPNRRGGEILSYVYNIYQSDNPLNSPITNTYIPLPLSNSQRQLPFNISIPNLIENTRYYATLYATNIIGSSLVSPPSPNITVFTTPNPPLNVISTPLKNSVSIQFEPGNNNSLPIKNHRIRILNINNIIINETIISITTQTIQTQIITNLIENQTYTARVSSFNDAGYGLETISLPFIPYKEPEVPQLTTITPGKNSFIVNWIAPFNNNSNILRYTYRLYKAINIGDIPVLVDTNIISKDVVTYEVNGLDANAIYSIEISATNDGGESFYSTRLSTIPYKEPDQPNPAELTKNYLAVDGNLSNIEPNENSSPILYYTIYLYNGITNTRVVSRQIEDYLLPFTFDGLIKDTPYYVKITATNIGGESAESISSPIVYPYGIPDKVVNVNAIGGNKLIRITYNNPTTNIYNPIISYRIYLDWSEIIDEYTGEIIEKTQYRDVSNTLLYTWFNLLPNITYSVSISTYNGVYSERTAPVNTLVYKEPNIPSNIILIGKYESLSISFIEPLNNSSPIIAYKYINTENGAFTVVDINDVYEIGDGKKYIDISNVIIGKQYSYYLLAQNSAGNSNYPSSPTNIATPYTVPFKPIILSVNEDDASVIITFKVHNGYSPINKISYEVLKTDLNVLGPVLIFGLEPDEIPQIISVNGFEYTYSLNIKRLNNSFLILRNKFINGSPYNIRLFVSNLAGDSDISEYSRTFIPYGFPSAPIITASSLNIETKRYTGFISCNNFNGRQVTQYKYSLTGDIYDESDPYNYGIIQANISSPNALTPFSIKLHAGLEYEVVFAAYNIKGYSNLSVPYNVYFNPTEPDAPIILDICANAISLVITIEKSYPNGEPVIYYSYSINGGPYSILDNSYLSEIPLNPTKLKLTIENYLNGSGVSLPIQPLTIYNVQLKATNIIGTSESSPAFPAVKTPSVPEIPYILYVKHVINSIPKINIYCILPNDNSAPINKYTVYIQNQNIYPKVDLSYQMMASSSSVQKINGNIVLSIPQTSFVYESRYPYILKVNAQNRIGFSSFSIVNIGYYLPVSPLFTVYAGNKSAQIIMDVSQTNILPIIQYQYQINNGVFITKNIDASDTLIVSPYNQELILNLSDLSNSILSTVSFIFKNAIGVSNTKIIKFKTYDPNDLYLVGEYDPTQQVNYLSPETTVSDYCEQRRMLSLYNIPAPRLEIKSPYDNGYTVEELNMRRKAEILKYTSNRVSTQTNNMTRKEKYAYASSNYTQLKGSTLAFLVDACLNPLCRPPKPTSSSDVPGPSMLLYEDASVPLYNYTTFNRYSYGITYDISSGNWRFYTEENLILVNMQTQSIGTLIIEKNIASPTQTYNMRIPIGIYFTGSNAGLDTRYTYDIRVVEIKVGIFYNINKVLEFTRYNPEELAKIKFQPLSSVDISSNYYLTNYLGDFIVDTFTLSTMSNYVYKMSIYVKTIITAYNNFGEIISDGGINTISVKHIVNYGENMNVSKNINIISII